MIACFAIGNSDDKLPQAAWSSYVNDIYNMIEQLADDGAHVQFAGYSAPGAPWQNAMWAVQLPEGWMRGALRAQLAELAGRYRQDAIAWWEADEAEMIPPAVMPS